jgi:hypothetical protein
MKAAMEAQIMGLGMDMDAVAEALISPYKPEKCQ